MANTINKIYARANAAGIVTYIFSQAFDTPLETDVCIDDTTVYDRACAILREEEEEGRGD